MNKHLWRKTICNHGFFGKGKGQALALTLMLMHGVAAAEPATNWVTAPAPLVFDPITGNAGDPTYVFNHDDHSLWVFYSQRRQGSPAILPFTWYHGTDIGLASSSDGGRHWFYRGTAEGLNYQPGRNTFWAPEVIWHAGLYHMFVTVLPGVPVTADDGKEANRRDIVHYTSTNLFQWKCVGPVLLSATHVIDPVVAPLPGGTWRMWYKNEEDQAHIWAAESSDLDNWKVVGPAITNRKQEGPFVFHWQGRYWMITDWWAGMGVYHSEDAQTWTLQPPKLLDRPGKRRLDNSIGGHCCVLTQGDRAFIIYQAGPAAGGGVVQVAELKDRKSVV